MLGSAVCLLLAAGVSRGKADENPSLTYRLRIPAVATDSGTAHPRPEADLVVTRHVGTGLHGGLVAYGEVYNGSDVAIANITVSATARSKAGLLLSTRTAAALTATIGAGETGVFRVAFPGVTDGEALVTVAIAAFEAKIDTPAGLRPGTTVFGPTPLVVLVVDPVTKELITTYSITVSVLKGSVTNISTEPIGRIRAMVALYDAAGNVAFVIDASNLTVAFQPPGPIVLAPGQTGTFEALVTNAEYLAIPGPVLAAAFVTSD